MAIAIYTHPAALSASQYDEVMQKLDAAGQGEPKGRLHHSTFGSDDQLMIYDVWDSQEDFEAFGAVLMPILAEVGLDPGQPDVMPVHSIVQ